MRVLHVAAGNLFGGIERMLLTLVDASRQAESGGHEVAVAFDGRFARELRDAGSSPWVLGDARFSRPDTVWRARRALRRALAQQRYDAVIAHAPWSTALAAPAVRRANLPLFSWIHDAPHPDQWPERRVARMRPDRFICNSRYTAGLVARWMPGIATDVIHPPVAASAPSTDRAGVRREFGEPDDAVVVLMAARMEPWKGHRVLLDAAQHLRGNVAIWIAGAAQRPHEAAFVDELSRAAVAPRNGVRVRLLGERADVPRLMHGADVYCQPNTSPEPFGVVFVEALAAGVPVVTVAAGGALEIVDDTCGILVPRATAEDVAGALQRLIDDPAHRRALGQRGPARARRISDPSLALQRIEQVLNEHRTRVPAA
jgi:glycosyltransferase involved in cell wall biosynthesis